jgi:RND family efflux transporter MFP subunit
VPLFPLEGEIIMTLPDTKGHLPATGRRLRIFAAVVAFVLVAGFLAVYLVKSGAEKELSKATAAAASTQQTVDVVTVEKAPASLDLTLPGETAAWYESVIYARVDGYVAKWKSDIGDHVRKGQVLATIDTPDLDAQLIAAKAKLKAAQAVVVARQADALFAKTTHQRWKDSPKGVVSEQEREDKKAGYDSATARLNEAVAQVGLAQADVDRYTSLTQFKQVTAPYAGTITERRIDIGNLVTAGSTSNTTSLYRMVQDDPIRIFTDVPQSAAGYMKPGLVTHVSAGNIPDRVFKGKSCVQPRPSTGRHALCGSKWISQIPIIYW